jgi:hypothetical protein
VRSCHPHLGPHLVIAQVSLTLHVVSPHPGLKLQHFSTMALKTHIVANKNLKINPKSKSGATNNTLFF